MPRGRSRPGSSRLARNLALDQLRRRRPESLDDVDEPAAPARGRGRPARARRGGAADHAPAGGGRALAPLDREVLSLRFEEELALPQLAVTLGVPVPTAKARLYRALARLRERLLAGGARRGRGDERARERAAGARRRRSARRPRRQDEVEAHLGECAACAARGGRPGAARRGAARAARAAAVAARSWRATVEAVEVRFAERAERAWNRAALGFLVAFAWTLAVVAWLVIDLVAGELALRLVRPMGRRPRGTRPTSLAGWLSAGAAAVLLGRRAREEGRIA